MSYQPGKTLRVLKKQIKRYLDMQLVQLEGVECVCKDHIHLLSSASSTIVH